MNVSTPASLLQGEIGSMTGTDMSTTEEDGSFMRFFDMFALFWQIVGPVILVSGILWQRNDYRHL